MAGMLLAERSPEQLAAALVKVYRSRLPTLEDVLDPGNGPQRAEARERPGKAARSERPTRSVLARRRGGSELDIGRSKNADPKWLLPMICRKGNVTRQDIGAIRIFDHETKVEVAESVAAQFIINMRRSGGDNIRIERLRDGPEQANSEAPPKNRKPKNRPGAKQRSRSKA